MLYSMPKIGKTTIASELEDSLLIDIEDGSDFVDAVKIKANSWKELYQIGEAIKEQGKPYKRIFIDTVTVLSEQWADDLAKSLYLNSPMAAKKYKANPELLESMTILVARNSKGEEFNSGYQWIRLAYTKCFNYLLTLPTECLILLAHVRDVALVDKEGNSVSSTDLSLTGKIKQMTCARADAIGYLYRTTIGAKDGRPISQLRISFYSGTEILSCARCKHLAGEDFEFDWNKIFLSETK